MKKKLLISIRNIIFFSNLIFYSYCEGVENIDFSPFLIFENISFMSYQKGLPCGLQLKILSSESVNKSTIDGSLALSYIFSDRSVSYGFIRDHTGYQIFSSGFSNKFNYSSLGLLLKIENDNNNLLPNADFSYSFNINKRIYLSTNIKNFITVYNSVNLFPEFNLSILSEMKKIKIKLAYKGTFYEYEKFEINNGFLIGIDFDVLSNHKYLISFENQIYQDKNREIITEAGLFFGFNIKIKNFINGLSIGYQHNVNNSYGYYVNNILINPFFFVDKKPPSSILSYDSITENIILFRISILENESLIKKWSLIITKNIDKNIIVKSFSGGNIPPNIVKWDFKDSFGSLYNKDTLLAQIIIVDNSNNIGVSPLIIIFPHKN